MDAFHKVQCLEEDLRHCRYNVTEDIKVHLRKMRKKKLDLAGFVHTVPFTTMMMYVLQSLPAKIDEFTLIQTQDWCENYPASNIESWKSKYERQARATKSDVHL